MSNEDEEIDPEAVRQRVIAGEIDRDVADDIEPTDFAKMVGQIHYLYTDPKMTIILLRDPHTKPFYPLSSPVFRTGRLDNPTEIQILKREINIALRFELMVKSKEARLSEFYALKHFLHGCVEDRRNGWRGKLTTEKVKITKIEGTEKKRKKWFGLF